MSKFTVREPHPTVVENHFAHAGRGGAGNYFRAPATTPASGVPTVAVSSPPATTSTFYSGRGGAGNAHVKTKRPVLSFDDEFKAQTHIEQKPYGYTGRGGAGNVYVNAPNGTSMRKGSDASSRRSSSSSSGSVRSGFWGRLSLGSRQ